MKGNKAVFVIVIIVLAALAAIIFSISSFYQNNQTQQGYSESFEGTVAKIDDSRILVIKGKDAAELKGQTEEEMLEGVSEAIWFSLSIDQVKTVKEMDSVRISYSSVNESFPGQASANNVKIISDDTK
jgi:regulator of protease activity HflC (stomatin/prohibitin superfamily)